MTTVDPRQIKRPDILAPDASPLIHLSQAGALDLLHEIGGTVVVVDLVHAEITRDMAKPEARRLADWIASGSVPGSNRPIRVEETSSGEAQALARQTKPDFTLKDGGEIAIVQWLAENIQNTDETAIVIYETGKVPAIVRNQGVDADIDVLTTRAFLELAEHRGLIASANEVWSRIQAASPTTNPRSEAVILRRTPNS